MKREELEMRKLVRESDVIDKTDASELAKAFNHLWDKYIEQEPCEDCVSRQAAINACLDGWNKDFKEIVTDIRTLPPVTPTHKTGKWKRKIVDDGYNADWKCSECGYKEMTDFPTKYCPNCGAKMV